jgi:signal transduction histidine kinase
LQFLGLRFSLFAAGLLQRRSLQARLRRSRVSDRVRNGTGIAAEVRANVFEQFFPIKEQGLGMTIVRSIIEYHGGTVEAENVADGGARFNFTLPPAKPVA